MGITPETTIAQGLLVKTDVFKVEVRQRGCAHSASYLGESKFCPECGKAYWIGEESYVTHYDPEEPTFGGFELLAPEGDEDYALITVVQASTGKRWVAGRDSGFVKLPELETVELVEKRIILERLAKEAGIWNPENFGIWAVDTSC